MVIRRAQSKSLCHAAAIEPTSRPIDRTASRLGRPQYLNANRPGPTSAGTMVVVSYLLTGLKASIAGDKFWRRICGYIIQPGELPTHSLPNLIRMTLPRLAIADTAGSCAS